MVRSLGVQKPTPGFTLNCRYCSPWFSSEKEAPLSWMATTARCLQGVVLPADPCSTKGCGNCKAVLSPRQSRMGSRKSTDFRGCRPVPLNHAPNTTRLLGSGLLKGPQNLADVGSVLGMLQHLVPPLPGDILLSLCFLHLEHSPLFGLPAGGVTVSKAPKAGPAAQISLLSLQPLFRPLARTFASESLHRTANPAGPKGTGHSFPQPHLSSWHVRPPSGSDSPLSSHTPSLTQPSPSILLSHVSGAPPFCLQSHHCDLSQSPVSSRLHR